MESQNTYRMIEHTHNAKLARFEIQVMNNKGDTITACASDNLNDIADYIARYDIKLTDSLLCIQSAYSRDKSFKLGKDITGQEAAKLVSGATVLIHNYLYDTFVRAKVTSVETWKRKDDVIIHLKYGMYDFFTIEYSSRDKTSDDRQLNIFREVI